MVKPIAIISLLLILSCSLSSYGQGENNIWCFGFHAGIDFNGGPPAFFSTPNIIAGEGSATVAGTGGNLLFYATPGTVWDRNNNIMPNGTGLLGDNSATQGAAIVQSFTDTNRYYLFSMSSYAFNSLYYSVIDMTLNGGMGDVVIGQKNILLDTNMFEKMVVARGSDCYDWLLVHHKSAPEFHAFKIDASGIAAAPVISTSGFLNFDLAYGRFEMKVSPNTNLIAMAQIGDLELHSFNNVTGQVYNAMQIDTIGSYGISFSPDASKLYVSGNSPFNLYQYDLSLLPNVAAVTNSRNSFNNSYQGGMRIGPDNKIYLVCCGGEIRVINNPNLAGAACNYDPTPIHNFSANGSTLGNDVITHKGVISMVHNISFCVLDSFVVSAPAGNNYLWSDGITNQTDTFNAPGTKWVTYTGICDLFVDTFHVSLSALVHTIGVTDTNVCLVNNVPIFSAPGGYSSYLWNDGKTTQTDTMASAGTKWVVAQTDICNMHTDTFHLHAMPIATTSAAKDTNVCFVNNIPLFSGAPGYNTYLWNDGFTIQQDTMSQPGTKWVQAQTGCTMHVDTFYVHDWRDTTKTSFDTSHCVAYSPIPVTAPGGYTSYLWRDGKTSQTDTFFTTGTKWVTALNGCSMLVDTVHFTATAVPADSITMHGIDTAICFELGSINVSAPSGFTFYLWNDGLTTQTNLFAGPATKWVYAQKLCTLLIDTFAVSSQGTDTTTSAADTFICFSSQATITAAPGYLTYLWDDGNTTSSNTLSTAGIKYVQMHNACAQAIDTFHVYFANGLSVSLGKDTSLCKGETLQLHANTTYPGVSYLWQDNSTAAVYNATEGGDYIVKVSVGPCAVSDTVRIHQKVIDAKLGKGLVPCGEQAITLDPGVDSSTYLWQDGSTNRTFSATKEGTYQVKVTQGLCSSTATVNVTFEECPCVVVLPDGFSPNNDGKNDKFGATISCDINAYKFMIYNRWGNRVFYTENYNERWDGTVNDKPLDSDVFNYYLEFKDSKNKVYYYKGNITLLR